jgi:hypothetical protein
MVPEVLKQHESSILAQNGHLGFFPPVMLYRIATHIPTFQRNPSIIPEYRANPKHINFK